MTTTNNKYVSIDPAIYEKGGFYDCQSIYSEIQQNVDVSYNIDIASINYRSTSRVPFSHSDNLFGSESAIDRLLDIANHSKKKYKYIASGVMACIRQAVILDRAIYICHNNTYYAVYETHRRCDRRFLTYTDPSSPKYDLPDDRAYVLLTSAGTFNWGHWLIDDLTKIRSLINSEINFNKKICILLHGMIPSTDRAREESIRQLFGSSKATEIRFLRPDTAYRAQILYYPSPLTYHPYLKHPLAIRDLADTGRSLVDRRRRWKWLPIKRYPTELFVIRQPALGRVPENWQELHDLVIARGFMPFDPQGVSFSEQVATFTNAERIVGIMGAAMSNTVFCSSGSRILYFAPDSFLDPFYPDLAVACGHDYAVCYGAATDWKRAAKSNFILEREQIQLSLDWICRA